MSAPEKHCGEINEENNSLKDSQKTFRFCGLCLFFFFHINFASPAVSAIVQRNDRDLYLSSLLKKIKIREAFKGDPGNKKKIKIIRSECENVAFV